MVSPLESASPCPRIPHEEVPLFPPPIQRHVQPREHRLHLLHQTLPLQPNNHRTPLVSRLIVKTTKTDYSVENSASRVIIRSYKDSFSLPRCKDLQLRLR